MNLQINPPTSLNSEQQIAVEHIEGPMLVLAGAGSGKTRIVTQRIAHLLSLGIPAEDILAVTFTNKAAEEMKQRIMQMASVKVLTCTFHSLCARILRESIHYLGFNASFVILDEDDSEKVVKEALARMGIKDEKGLIKSTRQQISSAKGQLLEPEAFKDENPTFESLYTLYQKNLKNFNALDFDDLLYLTTKLFKEHKDVLEMYQKRYRFILIDEYQDTNHAQYTLVKQLSATHHNVFAVGDPDQSIYSWRGANIRNILHFEEDYPGAKIVRLEQNYRSTSTILEAANALIKENKGRYEKNLWSDKGAGDKIGLFIADNEMHEATFVIETLSEICHKRKIPLKECAIFYRTNFQSRTFEDALLRENIPYTIIGGLSFYQRREIKDIISLLRMALAEGDALAFARTINTPKRGFGESAIAKIKEIAEHSGCGIISACRQALQGTEGAKLTKRQHDALMHYLSTLEALQEMTKASAPIDTIISTAIERSGYITYLKEDPETYDERRQNIEELVAKAMQWQKEAENPNLATFLEELTLQAPVTLDDTSDSLRLMTLHNGKGLEFKLVFLVGMEEDLLPHINVKANDESIEEERRLCYVGITRAKEMLFLTAARQRFLWGATRAMRPSRFLSEIPEKYLHNLRRQSQSTSYDSDAPFACGQMVFHKDFGAGIVQKAYNTSLGLTYDVLFPKSQITRTLVAKYARLSLL